MLPGEPTWLVSFEGDPEPGCAGAYPLGRSGFGIRVELGDAADPPEVSRDGDVTVILDGVLVDRDRLRSRLGGDELDGASLIRRMYLEHGDTILPSLRGAFALVIWDARSERLLCARDPTGPHPLFFARHAGRLLVASSHGALLETGRAPRKLDRLAIARWVMFAAALPAETFYDSIRRLPPGHVLEATADNVKISRHWWPTPEESAAGLPPAEAARKFEALYDQALERLVPLGRAGVLLSGGVDSASVAAAATTVSRKRALPDPIALSLVFPHPEANEEAVQRSTAAALGIPQVMIPLAETVPDGKLLSAALQMTQDCWTPPMNPWAVAYQYVAQEGRRQGCETILGGEGGNQWFETYPYETADLLRAFQVRTLGGLWAHERRLGWSKAAVSRELLWSYGLRPLIRDAALRSLRHGRAGPLRTLRRRRMLAAIARPWSLPDATLADALVEAWVEDDDLERPGRVRARADARRLESVDLVVTLEERFRYGRASGVRLLDPPLDPDVVSCLYGLPAAVLELDSRPKGLVRRSLDGRIGIEATRRLGLASPGAYFTSLIRDEAPGALQDLGGLPRLSELGILDGDAFIRALSGASSGSGIGYYPAWQALACEAWLQSHI